MNQFKIERKVKEWIFHISKESNSIELSVYKNNFINIYKSSFNFDFLKSLKIFVKTSSINEIFKIILSLILEEKFVIKEKLQYVNLILTLEKHNSILILNKIEIFSKEYIEFLINKIEVLQQKNDNLEKKIEDLTKENKNLEKKIGEIEKKQKQNSLEIKKIKELDNRKTQLKRCNLKLINNIYSHTDWIRALSIFPSGNLISSSNDLSIKIYDNINYGIIQSIENAHEEDIIDINILDENNFISCSNDKSIKVWIKKKINNIFQFTLYKHIIQAHEDQVNKVIYFQFGKIISCGIDNKIKIWEEYNNKYQLLITLNCIDVVYSILLLEDKNILISSGINGVYIWNFNNFEKIFYLKEIWCARNSLKRIDDDKIIIGSGEDGKMKIFSISKKEIIHIIYVNFICWGICIIKNKGVFLASGVDNNISVFRSDNYECIQRINNAHSDSITGIIELKDQSVASFGCDGIIKIWSF